MTSPLIYSVVTSFFTYYYYYYYYMALLLTYLAQSDRLYSLDLRKAACTPLSFHSRDITSIYTRSIKITSINNFKRPGDAKLFCWYDGRTLELRECVREGVGNRDDCECNYIL